MSGERTLYGDDAAVSPVIGVILMVAITVILAAVAGTFALNLAGGVESNAQAAAGVNADPSDNSVEVTWTANQNADSLTISGAVTSDCSAGATTIDSVGETTSWSSCGDIVTHIVVTANKDDRSTVIVDKDIDMTD